MNLIAPDSACFDGIHPIIRVYDLFGKAMG